MESDTPKPTSKDSVVPKKGMRSWPRYFALAVLAWVIVDFTICENRTRATATLVVYAVGAILNILTQFGGHH
jgi:hypothetical protein